MTHHIIGRSTRHHPSRISSRSYHRPRRSRSCPPQPWTRCRSSSCPGDVGGDEAGRCCSRCPCLGRDLGCCDGSVASDRNRGCCSNRRASVSGCCTTTGGSRSSSRTWGGDSVRCSSRGCCPRILCSCWTPGTAPSPPALLLFHRDFFLVMT